MVLPAADNAAPAVTLRLETAPAGYVNVHSRPAGRFTPVVDSERFRATEPPAPAVPEESVRVD